MATLNIYPKSCLQDEKTVIRANGLLPSTSYTLSAHLVDIRKIRFFSYAHYRSDESGCIDVSKHESLGGHFKGVFQMGFIAAMQPDPSEFKYYRFFKRDVERPSEIEIRVYEGHLRPEEVCDSNQRCVLKDVHERHYMAPGVQRIPIREGRVRGTLFLPEGPGPFPGVVDLFGTAGGLLEYRSAQLASRGVAALALAFFNFEDLPKFLKKFDLQYFREGVFALLKHEKVLKPTVGVIGVSKGADLALSMASFIPEVSFAIAINGSCYNLTWPLKLNENEELTPVHFRFDTCRILDGEMLVMRNVRPRDAPDKIIPIQNSRAKFFFAIGETDLNMNGELFAELATKHLEMAGKSNDYQLKVYKGAGHLIEPPYSPFCFASYHRLLDVVLAWGGDLKSHTKAQEDFWADMLDFIKNNLRKRESKL